MGGGSTDSLSFGAFIYINRSPLGRIRLMRVWRLEMAKCWPATAARIEERKIRIIGRMLVTSKWRNLRNSARPTGSRAHRGHRGRTRRKESRRRVSRSVDISPFSLFSRAAFAAAKEERELTRHASAMFVPAKSNNFFDFGRSLANSNKISKERISRGVVGLK